jgi:hypothetical protein
VWRISEQFQFAVFLEIGVEIFFFFILFLDFFLLSEIHLNRSSHLSSSFLFSGGRRVVFPDSGGGAYFVRSLFFLVYFGAGVVRRCGRSDFWFI